jgi:hypothetical protein
VTADIPEELTDQDRDRLQGIVRPILDSLQAVRAKQIVLLLNETKKQEPAPVFASYCLGPEMEEVRKARRERDPAVWRFGERTTSFMYDECLRLKGAKLERDWTKVEHLRQMKPQEQAQSLKRGIKYLRMKALDVNGKWAGILSIGFSDLPHTAEIKDNIDSVLDDATRPESTLVRYLREHFKPGGPPHISESNRVRIGLAAGLAAGLGAAIAIASALLPGRER